MSELPRHWRPVSQRFSSTRRLLVDEGLDAALSRKKSSWSPPRTFDGEAEAKLIALACTKPPQGYAHWTLRLLEQRVVELGIVEAASDTTIYRVLKENELKPHKNKGLFILFRRPHHLVAMNRFEPTFC